MKHYYPWNQLNSVDPDIISLQKGELTITTGNNSNTDTITAVTKNKSFLIFTYNTTQGIDDSNFICLRGQITNGTTLTFQTAGNITGTITISWFVVEFDPTSPATVQHGTQAATSGVTDIAISAVTLANSFPIVTHENNTPNLNSGNYPIASFTSTTNLRLVHFQIQGNVFDWQVVEHPNWTVTYHTDTMAIGDTVENLTIGAVTLADVWLRTTHNPDGNPDGDAIVRSYFSSTTQLRSDVQAGGGGR